MQRIYFLIAGLLFFHNASTAQVMNAVFIGRLTVSGGAEYSYKLFVTDSADIITGYSVTDIAGSGETKTLIRGTINRDKKQITFRETKMTYNKSKENDSDLCYVHAKLKAGKIQGTNTLKGSFTAYRSDRKTECGNGKIMLVCAKDALEKMMELTKKEPAARTPDTIEKAPMKTIVTHEREVDDAKIVRVLPGKTIELTCPSPTVTLEIWDSKNIDGDIITLMQDNTTLLDKYTISGKRKTVTIPMGDNKTVSLRLIAENEGADPVNTARIKVTSGSEAYYIDASTTVGNDVLIVLNRKG